MSLLQAVATALDTIQQNKFRSFLTTLGVIIGVLSVILLISLGEGAQTFVEQEFAGLGSNIILITPGKQETVGLIPVSAGAFRKLTYTDAQELKRRLRGVRGVAPYALGAGPVQYDNRRRDTTIIGVTPDFAPVRETRTQVGRFIEDSDIDRNTRVCVLGVKVKEELFGHEPALNQRVSINRVKHTVVGIMEPKGMSLGINLDDIVIVPLPSGQHMFYGGEDQLFEIVVATHAKEAIPHTVELIREILTVAHDYTEDFTITDQDGLLGILGDIFYALRIMLVGIAAISLLVGGIGIMNIMLVSVRERTREVGVRKAVGARRSDIGLQFLIESATLSMAGGLLGIVVGWMITVIVRIVYPLFPLSLSAWSVITAFLFSMAVGVFFGVYPALKAASVDPVEALRYE